MENKMNDYKIGTKCVQAGYTPENGQPRQIPIIQSTTFKYSTSEDMGKLFDLEASGYFYTRLQNPTNDHVAAKIAAMEGGTAAMLTSSGQAANFLPYSTYVRVETILWHHPRSTAEPSTSLQLRLPKWGSRQPSCLLTHRRRS